MQCTNHPQVEAAGVCSYCGKPFCSDCLVEADGRMYCKNDITKAMQEAKQAGAQAAQPQINIVNTNTNTNTANVGGFSGVSPKSKWVAAILCFFFGSLGVHRFYVGKIGTGLIWLFTLGFSGVGALIDFIIILIGGFRDKNGQFLK
jgi:hypothetical protein